MTDKHCVKCYTVFVPRNKNCDLCLNCKKPNKCIHGTSKGRCKIDGCFGNEICEHKEHKQKCHICKPGVKELDQLNNILRKIIAKISMHKNEPSTELVKHFSRFQEKTKTFVINAFNVTSFLEILEICLTKILVYEEHYKYTLNLDYYQIDHIKPKSKFNLANKDEFCKCCHYTNLQIVDKRANLHKNNKWTDENEAFWTENIIYKTYSKIY